MAQLRDKTWARGAFLGLENLLLPSFTPDMERLDEAGIAHDVRTAVRHGFFSTLCVTGLGSPVGETRRFVESAAEAAGGEILVGVTLACDTAEDSLELLRHAEEAGCTHAVVGFPVTFEPGSDDDVVAHVRGLAEATSLALVLVAFDHIGFTHLHPSGVPLDAYDRLADIPNVVALRVDSLEAGLVNECFTRYAGRLLVTSSNFLMLPLLVALHGVQWSGGWVPEALQSPDRRLAVECFAALREGPTDEAMEAYWRLVPAYRTLAAGLAPADALGALHGILVKFYQWSSGGNGGVLREPVPRITQRQMEAARAAFAGLGITPEAGDEEFYVGRSGSAAGIAS